MAITFLEKKKMQRLLVLVILGALVVTSGVVWWGFFSQSPLPPDQSILPPPRKVEIDTSLLLSPVLQELDEPREQPQLPEEVGRDNPFLPLP